MDEVVIGIDLGTQGARVLAVNAEGQVLAAAHEGLRLVTDDLPPGWFEQDPRAWWQAVRDCLGQVMAQMPAGTRVAGLAVDSTSGTILPVDATGEPLYPALMYNDRRSEAQAQAVQKAGWRQQEKFGYIFGSSYALPKIAWFQEGRPDIFTRACRFLHAADFIASHLTGSIDFTDTSNALKTGYDLLELCWPDFIEQELRIPLGRLPEALLPGQPIGRVTAWAAAETGLPDGAAVLAGATDGTAAQIASGASQPGDWNSTLGTTLVFKGISTRLLPDPQGRVYYHRHPEGWWMPGGASNTGTEWVLQEYPGADLDALGRQAEAYLPTRLVRYPLARRGERFPFLHVDAQGFLLGQPADEVEQYAAGLEGLALVERLAYDTLASIGLEVGQQVFITGGGTKSLLWSRIRASVLGKTLVEPDVTETAFGAAIIAASGCWFPNISQAAQHMVKIARAIPPEPDWQAAYAAKYTAFCQALVERGYIEATK
jgi:D-ribulokinase